MYKLKKYNYNLKSNIVILHIGYIYLLLFGLCYSGTIDPNTPDHEYLSYANKYECVGEISGLSFGGKGFYGSAIAIDDHHILTSAHIVQNYAHCHLEIQGKKFNIVDILIHKDFDPKKGTNDIAIGYSDKPFNLKNYPSLYLGNNELNQECVICGYGFTGTFSTGAIRYDGKRRAGLNIIDDIRLDSLICTVSSDLDKSKTPLEFFIANGDSGGALFINDELAGINSCIVRFDTSTNSNYNEESCHTRVSIFIDWIERYKQKER